jgi:alginate O-acetyltransferase complex protein AlgI
VLVAGTSLLLNFLAARAILRDARHGKSILLVAIAANLLALGFFKYLTFAVDLLQSAICLELPAPPRVALPLGISFFTFTQIAYLVDCYARKIAATDHVFREYLLFVSFFPHAIAGPILHHRNLIPQFRGDFRRNLEPKLTAGLILFTIGLFKKTALADSLATVADPAFAAADAGTALSALAAWLGLLSYSFQLYFDFSGYSDMAVGAALGVGMHIPFNFNSPYRAESIVEFWRRWHMSLSAFLKDYLYIPLGGNRHGPLHRYGNVFVTMLLGGIWHGAGLNFVIWGALHGAFIVINHVWRDRVTPRLPDIGSPRICQAAGAIATLLCVAFAWAFFRVTTVQGAVSMVTAAMTMRVTISRHSSPACRSHCRSLLRPVPSHSHVRTRCRFTNG